MASKKSRMVRIDGSLFDEICSIEEILKQETGLSSLSRIEVTRIINKEAVRPFKLRLKKKSRKERGDGLLDFFGI